MEHEYNPEEWKKIAPEAWLFTIQHAGRTAYVIVGNEVRSSLVRRDLVRAQMVAEIVATLRPSTQI